MSGSQPTPDASPSGDSPDTHGHAAQGLKSKRILACILCQQRKIKCERKFPCSNCVKSNAQCVPANLVPRQRKRRFPERELLERLRRYEDILRKNNLKFDPMHKEDPNTRSADAHGDDASEPGSPEATTDFPSSSDRLPEAKNFWNAMRQGFHEVEHIGEVAAREAWDEIYEDNDQILFGIRKTVIDIPSLQPEPVQVFRLWQIYLDNVNPLLKVTHTPTLQPCIIEAVSNFEKVSPVLEALMFGIYSMAIHSLTDADCRATFGSSRDDLLHKYQYGCQQALVKCGYLRTGDRDCLTAFYLYLLSVSKATDPRCLSSMLGVAVRIAQRMGIHLEASNSTFPPLEAEMRRRLWWSLILYDARVGEMADHKSAALAPTWDCQVPLSLNDSDLRPEMKEFPAMEPKSSEAIYAVVRSDIANFYRHTSSYLDFNIPALKAVASVAKNDGLGIETLEKRIEEKYLKFCDPENPLHFLTIWTTHLTIAKARLIVHYSKTSSNTPPTEAENDAAILQAITMLESDTKIISLPSVKGFVWMGNIHFPLPGYIHLVYALRQNPLNRHADHAWRAMSENSAMRLSYNSEMRFKVETKAKNPLFRNLTKIVLLTWDARVAAEEAMGRTIAPPDIVVRLKAIQAARLEGESPQSQTGSIDVDDININDIMMNMPGGLGMDWQLDYNQMEAMGIGMPDQTSFNSNINQLNWATMGWGISNQQNRPG
ncbi:unnamed protein product [Clonostachys byssicola]|uniref:Zn(2)-C6 fungal-type domain-containing protein n=1 Tax=Clonostachys byssicola TaxID=160290 RepID=A0A9N9YC82_9HYPO|nr:unnamed protein product [Clonostachys byssicola]